MKFKILIQLSSLVLRRAGPGGLPAARPGAKFIGQPIEIKFTAVDGREVDSRK